MQLWRHRVTFIQLGALVDQPAMRDAVDAVALKFGREGDRHVARVLRRILVVVTAAHLDLDSAGVPSAASTTWGRTLMVDWCLVQLVAGDDAVERFAKRLFEAVRYGLDVVK